MVFIDRSQDRRRERATAPAIPIAINSTEGKQSPIDRVRLNSKGEQESARHQQRSQRQWAESGEGFAPQKDSNRPARGSVAPQLSPLNKTNGRIPRFMADT